MSDDVQQEIDGLTFEQAAEQLEYIIKQLETGGVSLDDSVKIYSRGVLLKQHCDKKLQEAQAKIEKITMHKDGTATLEDFPTEIL